MCPRVCEDLSREDLSTADEQYLSDQSKDGTALLSYIERHDTSARDEAARQSPHTLNGERSSGEVLTRMMRGPHCGGPHTREPTGTQSWLNNRVGLARAAVRPLEQAVELEGKAAPTTAPSSALGGKAACWWWN